MPESAMSAHEFYEANRLSHDFDIDTFAGALIFAEDYAAYAESSRVAALEQQRDENYRCFNDMQKAYQDCEQAKAAPEQRIEELSCALSRLRAETVGCLSLARRELVKTVSVTNVICLENAVELADRALARLREVKG